MVKTSAIQELNKIQAKIKAHKSQTNNFGRYKYRNVEDIQEAIKPFLDELKCVIILSDNIELIGHRYYVKATATLFNESGDNISTTASARECETKKGMDEAQITGASSSYARKYALGGLLALDDTQDFDSHTKRGSEKPKRTTKNPSVNYKEEFEKMIKPYDDDSLNAFFIKCEKIKSDGFYMYDLTADQMASMVKNKEAFISALDGFMESR